MTRFIQIAAGFLRDDRGMETVEWGVLAALIVTGLITVVKTLGSQIVSKFQNLQNATS
jgi:pilus assembly protein Flp/PilA